jgi:hypothetical protein
MSLARMASLETYHVHESHKEESDDPHGLADMRSNRSSPQDLERGQSTYLAPQTVVTDSTPAVSPPVQSSLPELLGSRDAVGSSYSPVLKGKDKIYEDRKGEAGGPNSDLDLPAGETEDDGTPPPDASRQLQDQTNLLPVRQVVFVFLGLSCALFVSLLDQTM